MNTIRELKQEEKYNNMLKRKNKEISILKDDKEHLGEFLKESNEEIERLKSIIKEVREYEGSKEHYEDDFDTEIEKVYKILDKENKND